MKEHPAQPEQQKEHKDNNEKYLEARDAEHESRKESEHSLARYTRIAPHGSPTASHKVKVLKGNNKAVYTDSHDDNLSRNKRAGRVEQIIEDDVGGTPPPNIGDIGSSDMGTEV